MQKTAITFLLPLLVFSLHAQEMDYPYPSLSPKGNIRQIVGNTIIQIEYERPSVRKRQIFGDLVPWDEVWRTGAGHCTKISFDKDVVVGGQNIKAGEYALLTIPSQNEWVVILNRDTSLYGSYHYDFTKDVTRFIAIPQPSNRFYETLNFDIEILPNNARIFLSWANVQISFDVETTTDSEIEALIQTEFLTKQNDESNLYAGAAEYLLYQGRDLSNAITLADHAIVLDNANGWARDLKIRIYERLKWYESARQEIERYLQYVQSRKYDNEGEQERMLKKLKLDYERIENLTK